MSDEPGHYAYIQDIAQGRGFPIRGETPFPQDVLDSWLTQTDTPPSWVNWISQHPPAYHLVGALLLNAANLITDDPYWLYRAPRLLSSLSASLALIVFFYIFKLISANDKFAIVTTTAISFLPMYSHMASGTNHDTFLTLLFAMAILFFYRFILDGKFNDALIMSAFLSLASFTKITAPALIIPMLLIAFFYINGNWFKRIYQFVLIGIIVSILPGIWWFRNWLILNKPLQTVSESGGLNNGGASILGGSYKYIYEVLEIYFIGLSELFRTQPVIEHTFNNFIALIGWQGTGGGNLLWFQIDGFYYTLYSMIVLSLVFCSFLFYFRGALSNEQQAARYIAYFSIIVIALLMFSIFINKPYPFYRQILYAFLLGILVYSLFSLFPVIQKQQRIIYYSLFIILFYLIAYLYKATEAYLWHGVLRATHGRYWFPLIPLLCIAYIYPAYRLLRPQQWVLYILIFVLALTELLFYIKEVVPFYQGVF